MSNYFLFEYSAVYEKMWKNNESDRPQMTIWRMRIACWITKATNTHSEYVVILLFRCYDVCNYAPNYYVIRIFYVLILNKFNVP
jgi:hypothetical protein